MVYHFKPVHKTLIWGTEDWLISAVEGSETTCVETGQTLPELVHEQGAALIGRSIYAKYGERFPLLIKFIDAKQDLSVQVHPNDEVARRHGQPCGKTEMWYALPSAPGAQLYCGMKQHITPEIYKQMVADKTILDALTSFEVHEGDYFFIPAGRVHAICGGCRVCEIQQTSDTTYRIYDYDRRDKDGNARPLHTDLAAESINFEDITSDVSIPYLPEYKREAIGPLVTCPHFSTNVLRVTGKMARDYTDLDSFVCLIVLDGEGVIEESATVLHAGELVLLPATTLSITLTGTFKALETYIERQ